MIVGLTGGYAAGKGEAARYLQTRGLAYHSLSDVIRRHLEAEGLECSRENMIRKGNQLRTLHGPAVLAREIAAVLTGNDVVDSIRSPYEVEELRRNPGFVLLALEAPVEVRYARAMQRGRNENAPTLEAFVENERRENLDSPVNQQVNACIRMADRLILNDGTLEDLHRKIDGALP